MIGFCKRCKRVRTTWAMASSGKYCLECETPEDYVLNHHGNRVFQDESHCSLTDNQCFYCGAEFTKDDKIIKWNGAYPVHEEHKDGYTKTKKIS